MLGASSLDALGALESLDANEVLDADRTIAGAPLRRLRSKRGPRDAFHVLGRRLGIKIICGPSLS